MKSEIWAGIDTMRENGQEETVNVYGTLLSILTTENPSVKSLSIEEAIDAVFMLNRRLEAPLFEFVRIYWVFKLKDGTQHLFDMSQVEEEHLIIRARDKWKLYKDAKDNEIVSPVMEGWL